MARPVDGTLVHTGEFVAELLCDLGNGIAGSPGADVAGFRQCVAGCPTNVLALDTQGKPRRSGGIAHGLYCLL